jgi:hypothetical protein
MMLRKCKQFSKCWSLHNDKARRKLIVKPLKYQEFILEKARVCGIILIIVETKNPQMPQIRTASWRVALYGPADPIGISRSSPRDASGYRRLRMLEPGNWFRSVSPARFLDLYSEILDRLEPVEIYDRLMALGDNPVMLCWESASDCHFGRAWCHRHLVAQWLEERLGIEVPEVDHPKLDRFAFLRKHGIPAPDYRESTAGKLRIASDNVGSRNQKS